MPGFEIPVHSGNSQINVLPFPKKTGRGLQQLQLNYVDIHFQITVQRCIQQMEHGNHSTVTTKPPIDMKKKTVL